MEDTADRPHRLNALLRWASLVALIAVCVAAAWIGGKGYLDARDLKQTDESRSEVLAAAERKVVQLTTIGAKTSEDDIERLLEGTSTNFREEFAAQADSFVSSLRQGEVDASGEVVAAGVKQLGDDSATVLVAATGSVSNKEAAGVQPRYYRLLVRLVRDDGAWLVDGMEFVS